MLYHPAMKKMKEYLKLIICIFLIVLILPIGYVQAEMPGLDEGFNQINVFREGIIPRAKTFIKKLFERDLRAEMPGLEEGFNEINTFRKKDEGIILKIKSFINKIFRRE